MSTQYFKRLFTPQSLVLIGDDFSPDSLEFRVLSNIKNSGFAGDFCVVSSASLNQCEGVPCVDSLERLPFQPQLAIICSALGQVANIAGELAAKQVKAIIVLSRGYSQSPQKAELKQALLDATQPFGTRVMGPESMGFIAPKQKLNASYSHVDIRPGKVAYVGQSDLLGAAMLDWAQGQDIGFSNFVTLGDAIDVDISSVIDHLSKDPYTQSLLVQVDRITSSARHFLSAVRAAARNKLVLVLKSDVIEAQRVAHMKAPGLDDEDQAFDAAIRQVGAVRVESSDKLFSALETLTRMKPVRGDRLAVMANGQGPIALAVDKLIKQGL
ncbi:MAG: CoA-binding protein, partial [Pontibacterium sp.]